jgi:hypothetical protein
MQILGFTSFHSFLARICVLSVLQGMLTFVLMYSDVYERQGVVMQGTLVRMHLCEFEYEVAVKVG